MTSPWLIRIPEVFADSAPEILAGLGALPVKKLKRVFASILYVLAAYMLYKGLTA